ncbi:hypothetical protein ACIPZF_17825 [Pseudomonas sp. NPDC089752]|uniref:hypothetical protein n=1 Tax=Pseudomonas sp. NPDC089752 TaxID=3364472 RepID=UPI0038237341
MDDEFTSRTEPVQENMALQRRVWRFERVGWYALVVVILLGLAGVFGNGPLSDAQVSSRDGRLHVDYQRLSRSGTTDSLKIRVQGRAGELVDIQLSGSLFSVASIETLQPQPQLSRSQGDSILLQTGSSADGRVTLYLTLRSESVGRLQGQVRTGPATAVHFSTFLYP